MYPMSILTRFQSAVRFLGAVICLAVIATAALAQTTGSATLRGTIKDPQGAIVRGATVTLINEKSKDERKTTTSDDGLYVFAAIPASTYTLKIEATGFKTAERSGVIIETSATKGLDITTEVGQPTETVTVTATAETLQTETGAKE